MVLGALSGIILFQSLSMPAIPALLPRLVSILVLALSFASIANELLFSRKKEDQAEEQGREKVGEKGSISVLAFVLLMLGYWLFAYLIGLLAATFLFMVISPSLMGFQKRRITMAAATVITVLLFACFRWVFQMPLPRGIFF